MFLTPYTKRFTHRGCLVRSRIERDDAGNTWERIILEAPTLRLERDETIIDLEGDREKHRPLSDPFVRDAGRVRRHSIRT